VPSSNKGCGLFYRFGAFEEFKKHNIGPDGTLSPHKKFLCGLGLLLVYSVIRFLGVVSLFFIKILNVTNKKVYSIFIFGETLNMKQRVFPFLNMLSGKCVYMMHFLRSLYVRIATDHHHYHHHQHHHHQLQQQQQNNTYPVINARLYSSLLHRPYSFNLSLDSFKDYYRTMFQIFLLVSFPF